jgi:DNA-directed RNA polymerase I, II, and III subunit RPABC3
MPFLLEDTFEVKELDPEGRKFDLVSRGVMRSERHEMDCIMDVNVDVYPIETGIRFFFGLPRWHTMAIM